MAIGTPLPNGIPGFNQAGMFVKAAPGGGSPNATPLPSWYNIVRVAATANDSVALPPASCGGEPIIVMNLGAAAVTVFGARNNAGIEDTTSTGTAAQATTGISVPVGATMMFYAIRPQGGYTNSPTAGQWVAKAYA